VQVPCVYRYAEWIAAKSWAERHPLNQYLTTEVHLRAATDERG
jgi:hypothetical protein